MHLALFDLDHTLLPLDSDSEWTRFLVRVGVLDAGETERENERFYTQYKAGTLNIFEWLRFTLAPLAQLAPDRLAALHKRFMLEVIEPVIRPQALSLIASHQGRGDLCAIVTATNEFVTAPIARRLGIDALVATRIARAGDRITGEPAGEPCFREGKIGNTEAWLASLGLQWSSFERSWFYTDSANDLPLMRKVSHPVAANPDEHLAQAARESHWPILRLFP